MEDIEALSAFMAKLEAGRNHSGIINDMFEAAADWKNLAEIMLDKPAAEGWDLSGRLEQEEESFSHCKRSMELDCKKIPITQIQWN